MLTFDNILSCLEGFMQTTFWRVFISLTEGFGQNCIIFAVTLVLAIPLGLVIAFGSMTKFAPLRWLSRTFVWIIRGTPLMLQIFVVLYAPGLIEPKITEIFMLFGDVGEFLANAYAFIFAPWTIAADVSNYLLAQGAFGEVMNKIFLVYTSLLRSRMFAVLVAFAINYAAYFSEIYRGGIESIPKGQYEACQVLGMTRGQTFFKVILPQVIKRIVPPMGNEIITLVKDTSLARVVAVSEVIMCAERFTKQGLIVPLFSTAIYFLLFNGILTLLFGKIEKKLNYYRG